MVVNIFLFLFGVLFLTFLFGKLLEKIRIPWIFSALLIGLGLAAWNPFSAITNSQTFSFLSQLGMYFLLFIIGFELDLKQITSRGSFIFKTTFAVILVETSFGTFLIHYLFSVPWIVSILVAMSFATVGEAVLLPILDEFNLLKTKLGQTILDVGVTDDFFEIFAIIFASVLITKKIGSTGINVWLDILVLVVLVLFTFGLIKFSRYLKSIEGNDKASLFLILIFFIFLFIGIGAYTGSAALGALLAGIALKNAFPKKVLKFIDLGIRAITYGLFAPIFFLSVGLDTNIFYLIKYPLLILLFMVAINVAKIGTSYLMGKKVLGTKKSIILGIGLCVKFSTSIVVIKLLLDKGLIPPNLYSILIGTTIVFKFFVPFLMSYFIKKWKINIPSKR